MGSKTIPKLPPKKSKFQEHAQFIYDELLNSQQTDNPTVRPHQFKAVEKTRIFFNKKGRKPAPVLVAAPTGSGKTGIMVLLSYIFECKKLLIITPSVVISNQIGIAFESEMNDQCFFQKSGLNSHESDLEQIVEIPEIITSPTPILENKRHTDLVIVNAQKFGGKSASSLMHKESEIIPNVKTFFKQFDTLLVDEAHHYPAATWKRIVKEFGISQERKAVFFTATPYDANEKPIVPLQQIAHQISLNEIEGDYIRECIFKEKKKIYSEDQLFNKIKEILAIQNREERRFKHQAMVLIRGKINCDRVATKLNEKYEDENYAVPIYGDDRKNKHLADFNDGKHTVAVVCGSLVEGYDNPCVSLCVIMRNVESSILFSQFTGRCLRMKVFPNGEKDKTTAYVLTHLKFKQNSLFENRDKLAATNPVEENDDDQTFEGSSTPPQDDRKNNIASTSGTTAERNMIPKGKRKDLSAQYKQQFKRRKENDKGNCSKR